jgi:hypothetical protein
MQFLERLLEFIASCIVCFALAIFLCLFVLLLPEFMGTVVQHPIAFLMILWVPAILANSFFYHAIQRAKSRQNLRAEKSPATRKALDESISARLYGCSQCGATPANQFLNNQLLCSECYESYSRSRLDVSEGIFLEICRGAGRVTGKILRHIRASRSHSVGGSLRKRSVLFAVQATEAPSVSTDRALPNTFVHARGLAGPQSKTENRFARFCIGLGAATGTIVRHWRMKRRQ